MNRPRDTATSDFVPLSFRRWVERHGATLPLPGSGQTLARWQALCDLAQHNLVVVKLAEAHADALAILRELGAQFPCDARESWAVWASESAPALQLSRRSDQWRISGTKAWCSGALWVDRALLTAWTGQGQGPQLVAVRMEHPGIHVDPSHWHAQGMAGTQSFDLEFDDVPVSLVGGEGQYLSRPGFWHGGAGIAACWYGASMALAQRLHKAVGAGAGSDAGAFRAMALGRVDTQLRATAALMRETAAWIDEHPMENARAYALRLRLAAERCASEVLAETTAALGASTLCRDADFAQMASDLPVFVRQSHGARDFAALGSMVSAQGTEDWLL